MAKAKLIGLWIVQILVAAMFIMQGVMKLTDGGGWTARFMEWGYPDGFVLVIGVVELIAGIGLLIPVTAVASAIVIIIVMSGAAVTHLINSEIQVITNIVFIAFCLIVVWARRTQLQRLLRMRAG